jgi:integrase
LSDSTVRQVHWIVSGALDRAVVWKWVASNPAQQADKPPLPHPDPKPPSPEEAARLVERAFSQDPDWGAFVWVQMTTGMRRGEICGLRWSHVDLDHAVLTIRRTVFIGDDSQLGRRTPRPISNDASSLTLKPPPYLRSTTRGPASAPLRSVKP